MRSLGALRKRRVKWQLGEAELHNGRRHAGAKISCENVTYEKRIESHKHGFKRMAGWHRAYV